MQNKKKRKQKERVKEKKDVVRLSDIFLEERTEFEIKHCSNHTHCNIINPFVDILRWNTSEISLDKISESIERKSDLTITVNTPIEELLKKDEEHDTKMVKPLTNSDTASVLGCVIIGLFIECDYPHKLYKRLFRYEKMRYIFAKI